MYNLNKKILIRIFITLAIILYIIFLIRETIYLRTFQSKKVVTDQSNILEILNSSEKALLMSENKNLVNELDVLKNELNRAKNLAEKERIRNRMLEIEKQKYDIQRNMINNENEKKQLQQSVLLKDIQIKKLYDLIKIKNEEISKTKTELENSKESFENYKKYLRINITEIYKRNIDKRIKILNEFNSKDEGKQFIINELKSMIKNYEDLAVEKQKITDEKLLLQEELVKLKEQYNLILADKENNYKDSNNSYDHTKDSKVIKDLSNDSKDFIINDATNDGKIKDQTNDSRNTIENNSETTTDKNPLNLFEKEILQQKKSIEDLFKKN